MKNGSTVVTFGSWFHSAARWFETTLTHTCTQFKASEIFVERGQIFKTVHRNVFLFNTTKYFYTVSV